MPEFIMSNDVWARILFNKEEKIAGPGEKLVARVTNGLRDKTVEQIDTRRSRTNRASERWQMRLGRPECKALEISR
jgi:hypothetical protein